MDGCSRRPSGQIRKLKSTPEKPAADGQTDASGKPRRFFQHQALGPIERRPSARNREPQTRSSSAANSKPDRCRNSESPPPPPHRSPSTSQTRECAGSPHQKCKILNPKLEIRNNIKIQMLKIQNNQCPWLSNQSSFRLVLNFCRTKPRLIRVTQKPLICHSRNGFERESSLLKGQDLDSRWKHCGNDGSILHG